MNAKAKPVRYDYLIVGAGFAGSVLAERLASQLGKKVLLVDRRAHIGGNAYDEYDQHGVLVHRYGPHFFHTNDERVFRYLSRFTEWRSYAHRALAAVNGKLVPIPINRRTVNELLALDLRSEIEVEGFFNSVKEERRQVLNSEDVVVSKIGRTLYELLYLGYSRKQWGIDPRELDPSVCGRLPIRKDLNDRYFNDRFQAIPSRGYTSMFRKMVTHPNIDLLLKTDYRTVADARFNRLIFTGEIDAFFDYVHGRLPYRSLRFEFETHDCEYVQPVAVINYPNTYAFTRSTEFKHITGQRHPKTTIAKEYPQAEGDPYYPIPRRVNRELYEKYEKDAAKLKSVMFVGRLATYQYYNMDQVTAQSLTFFERIARGSIR